MSIASFDALPWESICYASITLCCIAVIFKHCFETVEKVIQLAVIFFAGLGLYVSWQFVQQNGWKSAWLLLSGKFEEQRGQIPDHIEAQGAYKFLKNLWA